MCCSVWRFSFLVILIWFWGGNIFLLVNTHIEVCEWSLPLWLNEKNRMKKLVMQAPMFTAVFTIVKTWKQFKCTLTEEWIRKMWCVFIHTQTHIQEYHSSIKRKPVISENMDGP